MSAPHDGHFKGGVFMRDFVSNLADKLDDFLDYKHALGIKYDTCRVYLLELDGYNLEHAPVTEFDEQLWISMVDHVVVHSKEDIRVVYRDGIEK